MKRLVVLTGAGMSAESGIPTFRGADGLWEGHRIEEVATPHAWNADFRKVLRFYNERRAGVMNASPNRGHIILKELEELVDLRIITQNIDDLHERAGSSSIMHLHGEIRKARSTKDARLIYEISGSDINEGDLCELGSQLRPHIVWFHEDVPMMEPAIALTQTADIFLIVGTSLQVYPAASLVHFVRSGVPVFVVDPVIPNIPGLNRSRCIEEGGSAGLERFRELLKDGYLAG